MKKKIFCLLLVLLVPILLLTGCGTDSTSMYTYTDKLCDKAYSVKIQDNNNEWIEYTDIKKYVLSNDIGLVYIHRNNGEVIITHIENVIIYCK
jgi:hypothetical protein